MRKKERLSALVCGITLVYAVSLPCRAQEICEDSIFAAVHNDTVTVYHSGAFYNCCATIEYATEISGDTIDLLEKETYSVGPCYCLCCLDLSVDVFGLSLGSYLMRVWGYEYDRAEVILFGEVWVDVGGGGEGPTIVKTTQSQCYGGDFGCGDCNGDGFVNFADALYLKNYYHQTPPGSPAPTGQGDVNLDGFVNFADALYLKNYYYQTPPGSPPPCQPPKAAPFKEKRMER